MPPAPQTDRPPPAANGAGVRWLVGLLVGLSVTLGGGAVHVLERVAALESRERYTHEQLDRIERKLDWLARQGGKQEEGGGGQTEGGPR